jgi:ATP-binding cassette subfamily C protein CydD
LTTLKLFDRSKGTAETIAAVSNDYRKRTMGVLRVAFLSSAVLEFFSSISLALVAVYLAMNYLGYLSFGVYGEPLSLAGGFFILLLAPDFYLPLRELGTHYHARAEAVGAAEEILKILAVPRPNALNGSIRWVQTAPLHIKIRGVCLAFDGGRRPALQGINFDLRSGEQVVLVGGSGAGKTTTLNLLLGFLQPDKGCILINDRPLSDLSLDSWREQIGWIGQRPILFHGTIRENIVLGHPQATEDQIEQAAANAGVLDFSMHLPDGLETQVGEQGAGISRGQAQRVALARAFLKDAPILLLDEPTAGLDAENESLVMDALNRLARGRTVLLLTHRLTNIKHANRIVVLENGCVVEQGNYAELMAAGGRFYRMVTRQ